MNPATLTSSMPNSDLWIILLKSAAMLSLVLGILLAVLYLIRRFYGNYTGAPDRGIIRTLATHYVAPKERIVLLDVLGEKILIGVTPQQINHLATISSDQEVNIPQGLEKPKFFSNFLSSALGKTVEK